jgi:hypothetical protein
MASTTFKTIKLPSPHTLSKLFFNLFVLEVEGYACCGALVEVRTSFHSLGIKLRWRNLMASAFPGILGASPSHLLLGFKKHIYLCIFLFRTYYGMNMDLTFPHSQSYLNVLVSFMEFKSFPALRYRTSFIAYYQCIYLFTEPASQLLGLFLSFRYLFSVFGPLLMTLVE